MNTSKRKIPKSPKSLNQTIEKSHSQRLLSQNSKRLIEMEEYTGNSKVNAHNRQIEAKYKASFYSNNRMETTEGLYRIIPNKHYRHSQKKSKGTRTYHNSPVYRGESPKTPNMQLDTLPASSFRTTKSIKEGIEKLEDYCSAKRIIRDLNIREYMEEDYAYLLD